MARTNATLVQDLLAEAYDSTYPVTNFITVANTMVTKHCTDAAFTATELEMIERYLTAWAYCNSHPRPTSEGAGDVSESKQHREDLGLDSNEFGQMAKILDWSGALAGLDLSTRKGLRSTTSLGWAGKPNPEATVTDLL